jgi:hypothetical protein
MKILINKEESLSREGAIETWYWVDAKEGNNSVGAFPKKCFLKLQQAENYSIAAEQYYAKHGTFSPSVELIAQKEITFIQPTTQSS